MENNFYVGVINYGKRYSKQKHIQNAVLYSEDGINYLELETGIWYTTDSSNRDYVDKGSILPTDINLYKVNYMYLLSRCKEKKNARRKIIS